jgi:hypothetical protein
MQKFWETAMVLGQPAKWGGFHRLLLEDTAWTRDRSIEVADTGSMMPGCGALMPTLDGGL